MSRFALFFIGFLHISPLALGAPSNLHTVLSPFTITPSVGVLRRPVTKVETINITPTLTKAVAPSASAVAIAGSLPIIQRASSYTNGDTSNAELRDLLRSLLSELRNSNTRSLAIPPAPTRLNLISDSYSAPPRNTFTDPDSPSYPDSFDNSRRINNNNGDKPEKIVRIVQEKQADPIIIQQESPIRVQEVIRTVYQPVYVPIQYAQQQQQEVLTVAQPVTQSLPYVSAIPTSVNTGASAVAISTIHSSPALAIQQQQQLSLPLVQTQAAALQPYASAYASAGDTAAILDASGGGYAKK